MGQAEPTYTDQLKEAWSRGDHWDLQPVRGRMFAQAQALDFKELGKTSVESLSQTVHHAKKMPIGSLIWTITALALVKAKPMTLIGTALVAGGLKVFNDRLPEQMQGKVDSVDKLIHNPETPLVLVLPFAALLTSAMEQFPGLRGIFPLPVSHLFQHGTAVLAGICIGNYMVTPFAEEKAGEAPPPRPNAAVFNADAADSDNPFPS